MVLPESAFKIRGEADLETVRVVLRLELHKIEHTEFVASSVWGQFVRIGHEILSRMRACLGNCLSDLGGVCRSHSRDVLPASCRLPAHRRADAKFREKLRKSLLPNVKLVGQIQHCYAILIHDLLLCIPDIRLPLTYDKDRNMGCRTNQELWLVVGCAVAFAAG